MAVITRIRGWTDPGFTEDGPEAPNTTFSLPSATVDLQNLSVVPSAGRFFSEIKLGAAWDSWRTMSFLEVTYEWNNTSATTKLYGFVDSVELISDTSALPAIRILWHVDEWTTYLGSASLGFGHMLRRPVGSDDPIQSYERKYWQIDQYTDLLDESELDGRRTYWVLLAVGATANVDDKYVRFMTWPFSLDDHTYFGKYGGIGVSFPYYHDIISGAWDESLGVDPQGVYGAWVLPVCPFDPTEIDDSDPLGIDVTSVVWSIDRPGGDSAAIVSDTAPASYVDLFYKRNKTFSPPKVATEINPLRVTGFTGEPLGEIPVGMTITGYDYRIVASATECYIDIRFNGGWYAKNEGTGVTIPALVLDLTENAWSSYQYSGQREYDIDARNNQSIKSGLESVSAGALQGGLLGGFNPMIGGGVGAAAGAISGGVSLATDFLWFNEAEQGLKDKLAAKQTPGILISGGALDAINNGHDIALCRMKMDTYSAGRASSERSLVGVKVDEYNSSNDIVRASTGFYQIVNLAVKGSIPESAKRTISNRFAKGVKLI